MHGKPCCYCARTMDIEEDHLRPTRDHVHPYSKGGRLIAWCCFVCNAVKRDMSVDEWAIYRHEHPEWWCKGARAEKAMQWRAVRGTEQRLTEVNRVDRDKVAPCDESGAVVIPDLKNALSLGFQGSTRNP